MSSYFCFDSTPHSKYYPSCQDDDNSKPLLPQEKKRDPRMDYPGFSRSPMKVDYQGTDSNTMLIKTGGNALQAVDISEIERKDVVAGE